MAEGKVCGDCIAFNRHPSEIDKGECRLRPELRVIPKSLSACGKYIQRGTIRSGASFVAPKQKAFVKRRSGGGKSSSSTAAVHYQPAYGQQINLGEGGEAMDTEALRGLLHEILAGEGVLEATAMGAKWEGGTVVLKPGDSSLQSKEIPIDTFFHKVVMVRDRIRVMEQKINASKNLSDAEKVDLQQYLTRIYGSLTTFNVLFSERSDHFKGESS